MSLYHPASLIKSRDHSQELLDFLELDAQNRCIIDYVVYTTTDVAAQALRLKSTEEKRSGLLELSDRRHNQYCGFTQFVSDVVRRSRTRTSTILVALLYLKRANGHMDVPPLEWVLHRLFMGALVLATKYTLDSAIHISDWADATGIFGTRDVRKMELEIFAILDMNLSVTEEGLEGLRRDIIGAYVSELAHLADPIPLPIPAKIKTPRSRSPDSGDLPQRKRAKFVVEEEDDSDDEFESDYECDGLFYGRGYQDSPVYLSPPPLSGSVCSASSTSSSVTPPERHTVGLVRSRASMNLRAGFNSKTASYSLQTPFSPTIEVPMVDPDTTVENFAKSSAAGWQLIQWFKTSQWAAA